LSLISALAAALLVTRRPSRPLTFLLLLSPLFFSIAPLPFLVRNLPARGPVALFGCRAVWKSLIACWRAFLFFGSHFFFTPLCIHAPTLSPRCLFCRQRLRPNEFRTSSPLLHTALMSGSRTSPHPFFALPTPFLSFEDRTDFEGQNLFFTPLRTIHPLLSGSPSSIRQPFPSASSTTGAPPSLPDFFLRSHFAFFLHVLGSLTDPRSLRSLADASPVVRWQVSGAATAFRSYPLPWHLSLCSAPLFIVISFVFSFFSGAAASRAGDHGASTFRFTILDFAFFLRSFVLTAVLAFRDSVIR